VAITKSRCPSSLVGLKGSEQMGYVCPIEEAVDPLPQIGRGRTPEPAEAYSLYLAVGLRRPKAPHFHGTLATASRRAALLSTTTTAASLLATFGCPARRPFCRVRQDWPPDPRVVPRVSGALVLTRSLHARRLPLHPGL
jgi:hypothetical protein